MMDNKPVTRSRYVDFILWLSRLGILAVLVFLAYVFYSTSIPALMNDSHLLRSFLLFLLIWLVTAYLVLPRIHRRLTKFYLPNYFIGRVRTADGMLGDPINLAFIGSRVQLKLAMMEAGWIEADTLSLKSVYKIFKAAIFKQSYPSAPATSLFLFSKRQDFTFQKEVNGNPRSRHHVRFWSTPESWWLPGGYKADWLGAGTFDKEVGLAMFTGQIAHKIATNVDEERDFIVNDLKRVEAVKNIKLIKHFVSGFHDRNGGGDHIITDGTLPFITLQ